MHTAYNCNVDKCRYYHLTFQACTHNDDNTQIDLAFNCIHKFR